MTTQAEQYVKMCIRGWTGWHDALVGGCGNSPWKRWREWADFHYIIGTGPAHSYYKADGKFYREETRKRKVKINGKTTTISERRLVRV